MKRDVFILLVISYIFYALLDLHSLPVLFVMSLFTYAGSVIIQSCRVNARKRAGAVCLSFIAVQIAVLCFFKYSSAFSLPVGISFYMLMAVSFLVDTLRGEYETLPSLTEVLLYISFFPTVISGPIMKSKEMIPQFSSRKKLTRMRLCDGVWMVVIGAFLKLVMADRLAVAVDTVYRTPLVYSGLTLFLASVSYTLLLLFDFAGYSYMAWGVSTLLGFDIVKNFNLPYISKNPSEFWRRWHISLSSWLKDYVYIPLGGSRKGTARTYINILLVMIVSGLWHGSTVNFLIWGILHGLGQMVHRLFASAKKDVRSNAADIFSMILNFLFVNFLWIPFRAPTLHDSWTIFSRIVTLRPGASYYYVYTFIFGAALLVVQFVGLRRNNGNNPLRPLPLDRMYGRVIFVTVIIATAMFAYFGNGAFIYAQF